MRKPKKNETLFMISIERNGNHIEHDVIVTSVGRKYFTVAIKEGYPIETDFYVASWSEPSTLSSKILFENKQEYIDYKEKINLLEKLRNVFAGQSTGHCNTSISGIKLETLREIYLMIINEK